MLMTRYIVGISLLMASLVAEAAEKRGLLPQDFYREVTVEEVALSPAADLVAFTVMTVMEAENKRHREIWMQRVAAGSPQGEPFRFTDPTEESSRPLWSPDGSVLSFTSKRGKDENATWFTRVTAPGGEAYHLTGVEAPPVWSPDGKWIAYLKAPRNPEASSPDAPDADREGWIAPDAVTTTLDPKRFDGRVVTSMRYKEDGVLALRPHFSTREKPQVWVVPAEGGDPRRLTDFGFDARDLTWSPDGRFIFFGGDERQDDEHHRDRTQDIYVVAREGGDPRPLTVNPGSEYAPAAAPIGDRLAFLHSAERGAETDVMVVELGADGSFTGAPRNLTSNWDRVPESPWWSPDGKFIQFEAGVGGNRHLYQVAAEGGEVRAVSGGDRTLGSISISADGAVMAYTVSDPLSPPELHLARGDGSAEHRVTSFNDAWLAETDRVRPERLAFKSKNGAEIEGWVVRPVGQEPGKKYPLILKIHGGPHSAYGNVWFRTFHVLSGAGFFVLYTNPRGSSGYGHAFNYATRGKWGEVDRDDYLAGVEAALARYPEIDPRRIGVSGGSYGGFMTNWLTATTDRFAAAVTSRSIVNWESWYGTSDAQGLTEHEFWGTPWERRELYRRLSPISYVEKVRAPTLIIHSENDYRTPIGDGEQWFMALKKRRVPVEMIRYPRSSHGLSRTGEPWLLVDRLERIRSWFVHWLIENPAGAATPTGGR
jgi:dipeptidyl aminopeptidase/acylaminoacyl peptidase